MSICMYTHIDWPWKNKMFECAIRLTSTQKIPKTADLISGGNQLIRTKITTKNPLKRPRCAKAVHLHAFNFDLPYHLHEFRMDCVGFMLFCLTQVKIGFRHWTKYLNNLVKANLYIWGKGIFHRAARRPYVFRESHLGRCCQSPHLSSPPLPMPP